MSDAKSAGILRIKTVLERTGLSRSTLYRKIERGEFHLSYTPQICIMTKMEHPNSDEPRWKERAVAIEYWVLTAFVGGAFIVGIIGAIRAL